MIQIRELTIDNYEDVIALWSATPGIGLSDADARNRIEAYLIRNPGLSFAAWDGQRLVGAVLCGHDGRRGYLHHLAVAPEYRRRRLGADLVARCLLGLHACEIEKCHLFVYHNNVEAIAFWQRLGWAERLDLGIMSRAIAC